MGNISLRHTPILTLFILLLMVPGIFAKESKKDLTPIPPLRSFTVRTSRGLPQSTVSAMTQDSRGTLWIGTMDGLGVFDGKEIKTVPAPQGGPEFLVIYDLKTREGGGIYVGGLTGIFQFDGKTWQHLGLKAEIVSLEEVKGTMWAVDKTGKVWVNESLDKPDKWHEKKFSHSAGKLSSVALAPDGVLVFAGEKGIFKLENESVLPVASNLGPDDTITNLLVTRSSTCWIGTTNGRLYHSPLSNGKWSRIESISEEDGRIESLTIDQLDRLWIGHGTGSVNYGNDEEGWTRWKVGEGYLPGTGIMSIFSDREGSVWFGLNGRGLRQLVSEEWKHRNFWGVSYNGNPNLGSPGVAAFGVNGTKSGGLFVCFWGQGVVHWERNGELRTYSEEDGVTENNRFALEPYPGVIWICARFALFESRDGSRFKKILELPSGFVYTVQKSPEGFWYANTSEHGVYIKEENQWLVKEAYNKHLPGLNVRGMTWLANGELWLATMKGIAVFKGEDYVKTIRLEPGYDIPRAINCILQVAADEVWAAGFGGIGIWKNSTWRMLTIKDGLPGKTIYSLAKAEDGSVWVGGSNGIGHFKERKWKVYTVETGLMANECNLNGLHIDKDGDVWFGTMSALSKYDSNIKKVSQPELKLYWNNGFDNFGSIKQVLPMGKRSLKISWVAPWLKPQRVEYRTRIKKAKQKIDWTFQQYKTEDFIERLDEGTWEVQVQARLEGSGEEGWTQPISAFIEIPPFWWETWWARSIQIILGLVIVMTIVILRTRFLKKRQTELKRNIDKAVAEIKVLTGLIPICAWCKKIRDDKGYWNQIEDYIKEHSDADFSHSICPECTKKITPSQRK